jgi:hypothetical protein
MVAIAHCWKLFGGVTNIIICGNMLTADGTIYCKVYREISERSSIRGSHKKPYPLDSSIRGPSARRIPPNQTSLTFDGPHSLQPHDSSDQGTFKPKGLIKKVCPVVQLAAIPYLIESAQTITMKVEGSDFHLVSYYTSEDIQSGKLKVRKATLPTPPS